MNRQQANYEHINSIYEMVDRMAETLSIALPETYARVIREDLNEFRRVCAEIEKEVVEDD